MKIAIRFFFFQVNAFSSDSITSELKTEPRKRSGVDKLFIW